MKSAFRRVLKKARKLLCVRSSEEDEKAATLVVEEDEVETEERERQRALTEFFARRGVSWPGREKIVQKQDIWKVKLLNLYPDLTEFYEANDMWQVKMGNLYPDLSEFSCC